MKIAFVLINTELGKEATITEALNDISEIKEFYNVYGVYDLVVRIEAETIEQLKDVIANKIRPLNHIKSILTMLVAE